MKKVLSMALSLTLLLTLFTFNTYAANYDYGDDGIVKDDYTTYPTVKKGDTGEVIEQLQDFLNYYGDWSDIEVDGIFGSKTKDRVRKFQEMYDLDVDGIVGPKTWKTLFTRIWG